MLSCVFFPFILNQQPEDDPAIFNPNCTTYLYVPINDVVGCGHRIQNWAQAWIVALHLGLAPLTDALFSGRPGVHGTYENADRILGFEASGLIRHKRDVPQPLEKVDFGVGPPTVRDTRAMSREFVDKLRAQPPRCNVYYQVGEIWFGNYDEAKWALTSVMLHAERINLRYQVGVVNVAIHIRNGDIFPTQPTFFANVVRLLEQELLPDLELHYHIFSDNPNVGIRDLMSSRRHTIHDIPALHALIHLAHADIMIGCSSAFSLTAALMARRPLIFFPPNTKEPGDFELRVLNSISLTNPPTFSSLTKYRLLVFKNRWLRAKSNQCFNTTYTD